MRKRNRFVMMMCAAALTICGTAPVYMNGSRVLAAETESNAENGTRISAEQAYERMNSGDSMIVLDVRRADEYEEKHIPGAVLIPVEELGDRAVSELPVKDAEILIYCRSGNRSAQAAALLEELGFTNVFDFGGINDWPYETESGAYEREKKDGTLTSFRAHDLAGGEVDETLFADYDLTMINIWATYCGPCLREMPELGELAAEYKDRGVQIVGIACDVMMNEDGSYPEDMLRTARELVEQTGADYIHLLPDWDLITARLMQVAAVPETVFVDSRGNLVGDSYLGSRSGADWAAIIDSLLEKAGK